MPVSGPTSDHTVIQQWAAQNRFLPAEQLPARLDSEPAKLCLVPASEAEKRKDIVLIAWEDFFAHFDLHGLAFVFDDDSTGFYQLLQIEEKSPYRGVNP